MKWIVLTDTDQHYSSSLPNLMESCEPFFVSYSKKTFGLLFGHGIIIVARVAQRRGCKLLAIPYTLWDSDKNGRDLRITKPGSAHEPPHISFYFFLKHGNFVDSYR